MGAAIRALRSLVVKLAVPAALTGALFAPIAAFAPPAGAITRNPLANPGHNLAMPYFASGTGICDGLPGSSTHCQSPCFPNGELTYNASQSCTSLVMAAIDQAQAEEGLPSLRLPTNYYQLSANRQVFVLVNLERISRGVPPLAGYSPYLDAEGLRSAQAGGDPQFHPAYGPVHVWYPPVGGTYAFGGAWAGNSVNAAAAIFGWFYDDGWGGPRATFNGACTSAHAGGCWGHRDELLGEYSGTNCRTCVAGAGFATPSANGWQQSYSVLIVRPISYPTPLSFSWDRDVVPYLPVRWERVLAPKV